MTIRAVGNIGDLVTEIFNQNLRINRKSRVNELTLMSKNPIPPNR
jgi:hypothetical protein